MSGINGDNYGELTRGYGQWRSLPEAERMPEIQELKSTRSRAAKSPPRAPAGGLVVRVYMRNMKRGAKHELARIAKRDLQDKKTYPDVNWRWADGIFTEPMPDVMWLTAAEWKSLIPRQPKVGDSFPLSEPIQTRLFRYHLVDGTTELAGQWNLKDIRSGNVNLTVDSVDDTVRMRLKGAVLLAADADPRKAKRGYEARLLGVVEYDTKKNRITRFDMVADGDCWGNRFPRPGHAPLGIAFELATGDRASDLIPPKGCNFYGNTGHHYFHAER